MNPLSIPIVLTKKGQIVFTLPGEYEPKIDFHNGLAVLTKEPSSARKDSLYICDSSGHVTSAADLGGTHFIVDIEDIFTGGYILIANSTTDFTGPIETLGILNTDLEYIVAPSQKLYSLYYSNYSSHSIQSILFYDGYLFPKPAMYGSDNYLDLRTGTEGTGLENLFSKMDIAFQSDFWSFSRRKSRYFFDFRYRQSWDKAIIDLTKYNDTLQDVGSFQNGTAPLQFVAESSIGSNGYFTILDESGSFLFDPVKTYATNGTVIRDRGMYLIISISRPFIMSIPSLSSFLTAMVK